MRLSPKTRAFIKAALLEDIGRGDVTTKLLIPSSAHGKAAVFAKETGIFCGKPVLIELARCVDRRLKLQFHYPEGKVFASSKKVVSITGKIVSILILERTLLNFLGHLSGIATQTHRFVRKVSKYKVVVLDTRKTTPLWREIEKYAVRVGGGNNHRYGLYDEIFVKENHRRFGKLSKLKSKSRQFVIEVRSRKELESALLLKPRVILFDHFRPADLKKIVAFTRRKDEKVRLEASGNVNINNIAAYARAGVDQISIGSLTHSVESIDFSMLISEGARFW